MNLRELDLNLPEMVMFRLRSLYSRRGYTRFKMNKFEEYDLYADNREFLVSDRVLTFTDGNGKLMALKTDVTLSIVKSSRDDGQSLQKLYYNENVYRAGKDGAYRELMQVGLECIGAVEETCIAEVLELAAESLRTIAEDCILNISHMGLLLDMIRTIGIPESRQDVALEYIGEKNIHELSVLCRSCGVVEEKISKLQQLVSLNAKPEQVLPKVQALLEGTVDTEAVQNLIVVTAALAGTEAGKILRCDFSAVDDPHYYNGILFKGFVQGLPVSILSGGQYDNLMKKMNRKSRAVGFAVYVD